MAKDDSEERTLPPTQKKLREARKKGQVPKSRDAISGAALAGGLMFILFGSGMIVTACAAMLTTAGDVAGEEFGTALAALLPAVMRTVLRVVAPLLLIVPCMAVLAGIVTLKGVPFSAEPITPRGERLNPAEGLKRMFGLKSWVELAKSVVKTLLIVGTFIVVSVSGVDALLHAPSYGLGAELAIMGRMAVPMMGAAVLLFLFAGGIDFGLQRWLFLRDQKMSITEMKRERKDMEGDPHLRRERKRIMREALRLAGGLGLKRATLLIHDGGSTVVGLRYVMQQMPAPVVVCRARDERGRAMMAEALAAGVPIAEDLELAAGLSSLPLGQGIPERLFREVALALRRAGVV
jgi:type III secretion protein U